MRDRSLLILDEATSALDETTEARVLERITANRDSTCLIITHCRSMLKYCNKVVEIAADGTVETKPLRLSEQRRGYFSPL